MKILVTGDFCPQLRLEGLILERRYEALYNEFAGVLRDNDLNITNLECALIDQGAPIDKTGRHLKATPAAIEALRYGGFNLVTLANNHIMDFGPAGLRATRALCREHDIATVGAGETLHQAERVFYHRAGAVTVAVLNFAEHEFSIAGRDSPGANPLNPARNYSSIREARERADFVFVIVHGGHEHYSYPSQRMLDTYRFFVDAGATVVIGHHAHCYSGFEAWHGGHIFYGLGNFLFDRPDKRRSKWNHGYAVKFTLRPGQSITYQVIPYVQGDERAGLQLPGPEALAQFESDLMAINAVIQDADALEQSWNDFVLQRFPRIMRYFLPLTLRLNDVYLRYRLPPLLSRERTLRLLNFVRCESHQEVLVTLLERRAGAPAKPDV
jgi:Bacterial capsule synthesis protein PGA_cap